MDVTKPGSNPYPEDRATLNRYRESSKLVRTDGIVEKTARRSPRARTRTWTRRAPSTSGSWRTPSATPRCAAAACGDITRHARDRQPRRQVRRPQRPLRRAGPRGGHPGARRLRRARRGLRASSRAWARAATSRKAQHCRAEFYTASHGWVPVDPADVRKVMLEEPGGIPLSDPTCPAGAGEAVRPVGDELAGLQLRARREAAELAGGSGRLLHVSAGGDRGHAQGQPGSGHLQATRSPRASSESRPRRSRPAAPDAPAPPRGRRVFPLSRSPRIYATVIIP